VYSGSRELASFASDVAVSILFLSPLVTIPPSFLSPRRAFEVLTSVIYIYTFQLHDMESQFSKSHVIADVQDAYWSDDEGVCHRDGS